MIKMFSVLGLYTIFSVFLCAQNIQDVGPDHSLWTNELKQFVSDDGKVDYNSWKSDTKNLEEYLTELRKNGPRESWSDEHKMAFWINAYNAFTVKLILDHYPLESITHIKDGKPWDWKWIEIGNLKFSLNQIENDILRPEFKDPRIHFALNCAAISCPPLYNSAFVPESLDQQLEKRTIAFIRDSSSNEISSERLFLSKIFEWYAEDFSNLVKYIQGYSDVEINEHPEVKFLDYDWNLNGY